METVAVKELTMVDRPYAQQPATRAAAARYLIRTDNEDLLLILGLTDDPVADERNRARALAEMHGGVLRPEVLCPTCGRAAPKSGAACRRSRQCRTDAVGGAQ